MSSMEFFFEHVEILRMPGFPTGQGFTVSGLVPGINILYGPNASGKTTLSRAMQLLLHAPQGVCKDHHVQAQVRLRDTTWTLRYCYEDKQSKPLWHRSAQAPAEPLPPLQIPPELHRHYVLALPDLLAAEEKGEDLAEHIFRELRGGYDLPKAYKDLGFREKASRSTPLDKNLAHAKEKVQRIQQTQEALLHQWTELENLRRQHAEAQEAQANVERLRKALKLLEAQNDSEELSAQLQAFPPALEKMTGHEAEQLQQWSEALREKEEEKRKCQSQLEDATTRLAELGLPEGGLPQEDLATWRSKVDRLQRLVERIQSVRQERNKASVQLEETRKGLGPWLRHATDSPPSKIDLSHIDQLVQWGREIERVRAELQAEQKLHAWLDDLLKEAKEACETPLPQLEKLSENQLLAQADCLRRAGEILSKWLGAHEQYLLDQQRRARQKKFFLLGSATVAGLAIVLGLMVHVSWWGLLLVALGLGVAAWTLDVQSDPRRGYQDELESQRGQGVPVPTAWEAGAVRQSLIEIDARRTQLEWLRRLLLRKNDLVHQILPLQDRREKIERDKQQLAQSLGFSPEIAEKEPSWLALFVEKIRRFHEAEQAEAGARASLDSLQQEADLLARELSTALREYGLEETVDPDRLAAQVAHLEQRQSQYRSAKEQQKQYSRDMQRLEREIADLQAARLQLLGQLGLDADGEAILRNWTEKLPEYRKILQEKQKAEGVLANAEKAWREAVGAAEDDQQPPWPGPREEIEKQLEQYQAQADQLSDLAQRIGQLEEKIAAAKRQTELEEALAQEEACRSALQEQRQRDLEAVVGHVLVEWLQESERLHPEHPVLQLGGELFERFTGGRYTLRISDDGAGLAAWDAQEKSLLSLDQLSSGTRIQLLVAARMAFVQHQERSGLQPPGIRLPMFFDETLANSDDQRAHQIIHAIVQLAHQGRQIFYLTAQQDELAKWKTALQESASAQEEQNIPSTIVDLAEIRGIT